MTDVESLCLELGALEIRADLVRRTYDRDAQGEPGLSRALLTTAAALQTATEALRAALVAAEYRGEPCPCEECQAAKAP